MSVKFLQFLHSVTTLFVGYILTFLFALLGCIVAVPFKIFSLFFGLNKNPAHVFIGWLAFLIETVCVRFLLCMNVTVNKNIRKAKDDEIVVCIGNHPSTLMTPVFIRFVTRYICRDILAVAKKEPFFTIRNPITEIFLRLTNSGIFVDRSSGENSSKAVRSGVAKFLRTPSVILIFPDMRRPSKERIEGDYIKFGKKMPNIKDWLHHTMIPRGGALYTLLNELSHTGKKIRVVNITTACSRSDDNILKISGLFGSCVRIEAEEVNIPYGSREELNEWLNSDWRWKNEWITKFKLQAKIFR